MKFKSKKRADDESTIQVEINDKYIYTLYIQSQTKLIRFLILIEQDYLKLLN